MPRRWQRHRQRRLELIARGGCEAHLGLLVCRQSQGRQAMQGCVATRRATPLRWVRRRPAATRLRSAGGQGPIRRRRFLPSSPGRGPTRCPAQIARRERPGVCGDDETRALGSWRSVRGSPDMSSGELLLIDPLVRRFGSGPAEVSTGPTVAPISRKDCSRQHLGLRPGHLQVTEPRCCSAPSHQQRTSQSRSCSLNSSATPVSVERAIAEMAAVATPEIPGGSPDLTASERDLIHKRLTETVVDPGERRGPISQVTFCCFGTGPNWWR